jgi:multisubunit Na+/H+ antiporter MnhC subunit
MLLYSGVFQLFISHTRVGLILWVWLIKAARNMFLQRTNNIANSNKPTTEHWKAMLFFDDFVRLGLVLLIVRNLRVQDVAWYALRARESKQRHQHHQERQRQQQYQHQGWCCSPINTNNDNKNKNNNNNIDNTNKTTTTPTASEPISTHCAVCNHFIRLPKTPKTTLLFNVCFIIGLLLFAL